MLKRLESSYDARIGRYWELMCKIKRIPYDPGYARAFGSRSAILLAISGRSNGEASMETLINDIRHGVRLLFVASPETIDRAVRKVWSKINR
jgi:hypothetical protein